VTQDKEPFEQEREVIDGDCHVDWYPQIYVNDLAILKLKTPIEFTDKIQPIELAKKGDRLKPGTVCNVAGWGFTGWYHGSPISAKALNEMNVTILDDAECFYQHGKYYNSTTSYCEGNTLAAGTVCERDSGGPLVCQKNGRPVQYAVISSGNGECSTRKGKGSTSVQYTDVAPYQDWVEEQVKRLSSKKE